MYTYTIFNEAHKMRNLFDDFFNEGDSPSDYPSVRIYEADDTIRIEALIPGVESGDIDIELLDGNLIIEGDKKSDYKDCSYVKQERRFGKFRKSIKLPYRVDGNSVNAKINDGILTVTLSKSEDAKPKKIKIN